MFLLPNVIAWVMVWIFWIGPGLVASAPTPVSTSDTTPTPTTTRNSGPNYNPYPYANGGADESSPSTTIIIVAIIGGLALIGAAWGFYCCMVARKCPKIATVAGGTTAEPTTMIYIPGENPPIAALPSLRYNAPPRVYQPDPESPDVGPGVILPPPPAYDVATGGRPPIMEGAPLPSMPKRERTESMWKDLLVSQGRD